MPDFAVSSSPAVQQQLDRLALRSPGGDRLGLKRIAALLDRLGRPQDRLPPVLHVAGTNGKGSTCAFLRAAIEAAGLRTHVFTSPHLVRFNERIRVAGGLIDDERLAAALAEVNDAAQDLGATFFEVTTAAAMLVFSRAPADACILEVGLGGRLDATNIVKRPAACGIAGLGLDHQQFLGSNLRAIAAEKAGVAKPGAPLVTQHYPRVLADTISQVARERGAAWLPRGGPWDALVVRGRLRYRDSRGELDLPRLPGRHQAMNAALAVAMLRHQSAVRVPDSALAAAMGWADWPARLQKLGDGPLTRRLPSGSEAWLDGGHNPSAAREVARFVARRFPRDAPFHLLFASLASKDARGTLAPFRGSGAAVHALPIPGHASRDPEELAGMARDMGFAACAHDSLEEAWRTVAGARAPVAVLIFGSLYLAGEILMANDQLPD